MANRYILTYTGFEEEIVTTYLTPRTAPDTNTNIEPSDNPTLDPSIMESVNTDEDKTNPIKSKRLRIGFNSGLDLNDTGLNIDVKTFSGDDTFLAEIHTGGGISIPFAGDLSYEDNQEAFQPQPNPVQLSAVDGLNSLRNIELANDVGHFSIIEFIAMCLSPLQVCYGGNTYINVVFNLYEEDTDPLTSHAFIDTFLDSLTFEKDVSTREDCLTVLTKILDALGCFIAYDNQGWWIIRWDEYDSAIGSILTHRRAIFNISGGFDSYETVDLTKVIAADYAADYEGYRLSQDNALRRFQHRAKSVNHIYKFETPKEVPCNSGFTRGTLSATQPGDPLQSNYDYECWTMYKDLPPATNNGTSYIRVVKDADDYETDRYILFSVQPSSTNDYYIESQNIPVNIGDKIKISCDVKHDGQVETADNGFSYIVMIVKLYGDDSTYYRLDGGTLVRDGGTWDSFDSDFNVGPNGNIERIFNGLDDDTAYSNVTLQGVTESKPIPKNGYLRILLVQGYKSNQFETHISNLRFEYVPLVNNSYGKKIGQQNKITGDADNNSKINIEHEMFISDSPKKLFKGALKKFDGTDYVLTETWLDYVDATIPANRLSWFIAYQWWNQFRKTRTVIETDVQGINSDQSDGIPGLIHRWKISHATEVDKFFMLTSMRDLNFRTCGWAGVFVETSDADGDRNYDDELEFKYIQ